MAFWLDHVDGQVARWRGTASLDGVYLDYLMHHAATFSSASGSATAWPPERATPLGGGGVRDRAGWTFLSLHNDCRYKAFFQRLKRESGYRVDGGAEAGRRRRPAGRAEDEGC